MQTRTEGGWRQQSDLVIVPDVRGIEWDAFKSAAQLVEAGEKAALAALPEIKAWLAPEEKRPLMPPYVANSTQALQV
jgi:hypothetical protein